MSPSNEGQQFLMLCHLRMCFFHSISMFYVKVYPTLELQCSPLRYVVAGTISLTNLYALNLISPSNSQGLTPASHSHILLHYCLLIPFTTERLMSLPFQAYTGYIFLVLSYSISFLHLESQLFHIQLLSKSKQIFKIYLKTSPPSGSLLHLWHH